MEINLSPTKTFRIHALLKEMEKYMPIAAASILAKTHRDELMLKLNKEFRVTIGIKTKATQPRHIVLPLRS